jgi:DNA-binding NtrC family response regulator
MTASTGALMQRSRIGSTYRVLLVDENAADLAWYSSLLKEAGYDVQTCNAYAQALSWLESQHFDFIIVSQGTHKFEGRLVLTRAVEIDRGLPVLVLARSLDMTCYLEAMQLGALDYFEKPLLPQELLGVVSRKLPPPTELMRVA